MTTDTEFKERVLDTLERIEGRLDEHLKEHRTNDAKYAGEIASLKAQLATRSWIGVAGTALAMVLGITIKPPTP